MNRQQQKRKVKLRWKLLLLVSSLTASLVGVESAYRLKIYLSAGEMRPGAVPSYIATSMVPHKVDPEFGYSYIPNSETFCVLVSDGEPVLSYQRSVNSLGNIGPPKLHYESSKLKILVFGDSFTATMGEGTVWPTLLEEKLSQQLKKEVCILNFGREGYGVLQMFDLAHAKISDFKPDLMLFCFITDDLNRARLPHPRSRINEDRSYVHSAISKQWFDSIVTGKNQDDLILKEMNQKFDMANASLEPVNYWTLSRSFLYYRIVWSNPFFEISKKIANPRITLWDFSHDEQWMQTIASLHDSQIPFCLIHLPDYREMSDGKMMPTFQQRSLLNSLQSITNRPIISVLDGKKNPSNTKNLFLLPHDPHPSPTGLEHYASAIESILIEHKLVKP